MAATKKKAGKREDWEDLDVNADSRLPASHGIIFMINSLLLAAASVCKLTFSPLLFKLTPTIHCRRYFLHNIWPDSGGERSVVWSSQCNCRDHSHTRIAKSLKGTSKSVNAAGVDYVFSQLMVVLSASLLHVGWSLRAHFSLRTRTLQTRRQNLSNRWIQSVSQFCTAQMVDLLDVLQEAEAKRSAINQEALALSLAYTNAIFLASIVIATFFILRSDSIHEMLCDYCSKLFVVALTYNIAGRRHRS